MTTKTVLKCAVGFLCIAAFASMNPLLVKGQRTEANSNLDRSEVAAIAAPDHIVVVIMENHDYPDIIGSASAPHINALATGDHSLLFTNYHAIEHPSQPNYLDLYAGCNQGVTDDAVPSDIPFTTDNLGRELLDVGKTFITYSEGLPSVGYNGSGSGEYARKHNPAANWMGTGPNQIPTTTDQPFTSFPTDYSTLPTVAFVVPNLINDMHDGSIQQGDNWIEKNITPLVAWAKTHNSLVVITWDEDETTTGGKIVTIFAGENIKPGTNDELLNHYSLLRTIEDLYGLRYACNASTATSVATLWTSAAVAPAATFLDNLTSNPNPSANSTELQFELAKSDNVSLEVFNVLGASVRKLLNGHLDAGLHHVTFDRGQLPAGVYVAELAAATQRRSIRILLQ